MDGSEFTQFERSLNRLEESRRNRQPICEELNEELQQIENALAEAAQESDNARHYAYDELKDLAAARAATRGAWRMPMHLSTCAVCLEIFQVLSQPGEAVPPRVLERFLRQGPARGQGGSAHGRSRVIPFGWRSLAASLFLSALGLGLYAFAGSSNPVRVRDGELAVVQGGAVRTDSVLPRGQQLSAVRRSEARFADGSALVIEPQSLFSFSSSRNSTLVNVDLGSLLFSVVKQAPGHEFHVHTALGEIMVVGTRFSVTAHEDTVTIFHSNEAGAHSSSAPGTSLVVEVKVFEGSVRVKNEFDEVLAIAGQTAVLRQAQPKIDIIGGNG